MLPDIVECLSEHLNFALSRLTVRIGEFLHHSGVLPGQTLCDAQLLFYAFISRSESLIKGCRNCGEKVNLPYVRNEIQLIMKWLSSDSKSNLATCCLWEKWPFEMVNRFLVICKQQNTKWDSEMSRLSLFHFLQCLHISCIFYCLPCLTLISSVQCDV